MGDLTAMQRVVGGRQEREGLGTVRSLSQPTPQAPLRSALRGLQDSRKKSILHARTDSALQFVGDPAAPAQSEGASAGVVSVDLLSDPAPAEGQPTPLHPVRAVPPVRCCTTPRPVPSLHAASSAGGTESLPAPELGLDVLLGSASAMGRTKQASLAGGSVPQLSANYVMAGPAPAAAATAPSGPRTATSAAPLVFASGSGTDTAVLGQAFSWSRGPQIGGLSLSSHWTLPPCEVTVRPKDPKRFWDQVKAKVLQMGDCNTVDHFVSPRWSSWLCKCRRGHGIWCYGCRPQPDVCPCSCDIFGDGPKG